MATRIGISGWRYAGWRGKFYPDGLPQKRELAYAAERFNSIELNGSFYSLQRPSSYARWRDDVPDDFVFAVKGGRYITHMLKLKEPGTALANFFASGLFELGEKLGPILWQFPPQFGFDADRLQAFFYLLPRDGADAAKLARRHDERVTGRARLAVDPAIEFRAGARIAESTEGKRMLKQAILFMITAAAMPLVTACSPSAPEPVTAAEERENTEAAQTLHALFADEWAARLARDPLFASSMGVDTYNDALPNVTPESRRRELDEDRAFLTRLEAVDRSALSKEDQLNYDLFDFIVRSRATLAEYRPYLIPILADGGFHMWVQRMYESMPFENAADYEDYLARLNALGGYFDQHIANMREGLSLGITQPKIILEAIEPSIAGPIVEDATKSIFFEPFAGFPEHFSAAERERLRAQGIEAIETVVVPAYRRFLTFFTEEYEPGARDELGRTTFPNGQAWYADLVKYYTTLGDATPEAIHELGLREVARIRAEMDAIIRQVEFEGSFAGFIEFMRTDDRFYVEEPEQLLKEAAWIAKQIDGQMPAFFKTLPRLPYGIMPVPGDMAPNYTTGRYWGAPIGGRRGGYYMVNTYALDKRPLYTLAALTAHEAFPGHHQQGALRQELTGIPEFRRAFYPHAFGEGWGLYAEKLGIEFGIYKTPYDHFGRLSYEMWRAARLVIDTGIHAKGWSREQARQYLAGNTALSLHNVRTEVDRYIAWPGQALAYKMGELKILEMKARAQEALGADFDIREFHDVALLDGGVTLDVLERQVEGYIERTR